MSGQPIELKLIFREFEGFERAFSKQAAAFSAQHPHIGVSREFTEVHSLYKKMVAGAGSKTPEYDLFLCVTDWLPELIASGGLTRLNEFLAADPPEGWPDAWSPSMRGLQTGPDGSIYGLAYHDGPEVFHYRTDLFESPGEQAAFFKRYGYELGPPKTWSQFLDVARFFTRPADGLWGTAVAYYPDAHNNVYDFLIHLWSRGGLLFDHHWQPAFHDAIGREALRFYVDLLHEHKVVSEACLGLDSVQCGHYYAQGHAAMMWNWCGFATVAQAPEFSRIVGKNRCTIVPRGDGPRGEHTSLNIYWVLAIPAGSRNKDAAYAFIKHAAGAAMDKVTAMEGGSGTRLSTWGDPKVQARFPYYGIIEEVHQNVKSPPPIPESTPIIEILNEMVDDAVKQRKTVPQALDEAAEKVRAVLADAVYYRKRAGGGGAR